MQKTSKKILIPIVLIFLLFSFFILNAQELETNSGKEQLNNSELKLGNIYQESFSQLAEALKNSHPGMLDNPLQAITSDKFEKITAETYENLSEVNNKRDFFFIVSMYLSEFKDGHANIFYSPIEKKIIPFSLTWIGDKLFISKDFNPSFSKYLGREVVKIADFSTSEFEEKLNNYRQTDEKNIYHLRKEQFGSNFFLMLYDTYDYFGLIENGAISFTLKDGENLETISFPFIGMEGIKEEEFFTLSRNQLTKCTYKNHFEVIENSSTLYFQMGTDELSSEMIKDIFVNIKEKELENLVIDLRNSGGGAASEQAVEFFNYLVPKTGNYWGFKGWIREGNKNVEITENEGKLLIEQADNDLLFNGNLVLFTNGTTFSSSSIFAMMVRDNKFGEIWGEPCGSNIFRYGKRNVVPMPKIQMAASFSSTIWNSAKPGNQARFIEPDKLVYQTIKHYISGEDALWEYYIQEIEN